jgi:hypothetical protein
MPHTMTEREILTDIDQLISKIPEQGADAP